jgi:hypothetical protein
MLRCALHDGVVFFGGGPAAQFLRGKMTASFREMRAISRIFPSENPSESE